MFVKYAGLIQLPEIGRFLEQINGLQGSQINYFRVSTSELSDVGYATIGSRCDMTDSDSHPDSFSQFAIGKGSKSPVLAREKSYQST